MQIKGNTSPDSQSGFTLIEMMISVFIFTIITGATFIVLDTGRNSWQIGDAEVRVQDEVRRGLYAMMRELRQTKSSLISGVPADGGDYSSIIFRKPTGVSSGETDWSGQIQYDIDTSDANSDGLTDQLVRTSGGTTTVLANNITQLKFRRTASATNLLWVELTAQAQTPAGRTISDTSEIQVVFRN